MPDQPGDMFGDLFGAGNPFSPNYRPPAAKKKPEKGPNGGWRAKIIKDEHYVPMAQVVEMLENNDILPGMKKRLRDHIAAYQTKLAQDAAPVASDKIEDVETGLCNGRVGQHHPLCIVTEPSHEAHFVEVTKS